MYRRRLRPGRGRQGVIPPPQPQAQQHPRDLLTILRREWQFRRQRRILYVQTTPIDENRPFVNELTDRVAALVWQAVETYQELEQTQPDWVLSVVLNTDDQARLIDRPYGTHRYFNSVADIVDHLSEAIFLCLENLAQSEREIELDEFIFELRYDRSHRIQARGRQKRLPRYLRNTIANPALVNGLYAYETGDKACGFKAIIYALTANPEMREHWTGDLQWYHDLFHGNAPSLNLLRKAKSRLHELAITLANQLGVTEDPWSWDVLCHEGCDSTSSKFVRMQPKYQVIIFNEVTRLVMERRAGVQFDEALADNTTFVMSYTTGHLQLIKGLHAYYGKPYRAGESVCYLCLQIKANDRHRCPEARERQCPKCRILFQNEDGLVQHKKGPPVFCQLCEKDYFNETCFDSHHCPRMDRPVCMNCSKVVSQSQPHVCGNYFCASCRIMVEPTHKCPLRVPNNPGHENADPQEVGKNFYAFDFESLLDPIADETYMHSVNLVVVRRCFTDQEWVFTDLELFIQWFSALPEPSVFYAHNLKGYDGRLLFEFLLDRGTVPQMVLWNGTKIMDMQYGAHRFRDTLPHLTSSLERLPKMLGLDESQFKKGFFPYLFNTPENQQYRGPIPDQSFFDPHGMSADKKAKFEKWHAEQKGVYDFAQELRDYCISDVRILAKSIEAYMTQMMAKIPYNPFVDLTSAGYAKSVYMLFHAPPNMLYRLSKQADSDIRQSMHGGRTDTRRMLREWSDDEIEQGYYGCYQDVQSLYPTVQFYDPMPVGKPKYREWSDAQPTLEQLKAVFGFVCCDIEPQEYLFHPIILGTNKEGRLVADLKPKKKVTIPTPELQLALENGYRVTWVYYWYEFEHSTELFKSYFRTFLKEKLEASGVPKWVKTDADWDEFAEYHRDELGIELQRENMIPNPARKTGAKILCNSLWGKFGQRFKSHGQFKTFAIGTDDEAIMALERQWLNGTIDIDYRRYNALNTELCIKFHYTKPNPASYVIARHLGDTNIAIASMVTSHARCRLWKELAKLGERVLYHDTDSIIYERDPNGYNIPLGRYLGEWEDETGGLPITKFVSTGPKCYSYSLRQPDGSLKFTSKAKGITLNAHNNSIIHYDSMKQLVLGDIDSIATKCLVFRYDLHRGTMVTKNILKLFQVTHKKGRIDRQTWCVYPFQ